MQTMNYSIPLTRGENTGEVVDALSAAFHAGIPPGNAMHEYADVLVENVANKLEQLNPPGEGEEYAASMSGTIAWEDTTPPGNFLPDPPRVRSISFNGSVAVVSKV